MKIYYIRNDKHPGVCVSGVAAAEMCRHTCDCQYQICPGGHTAACDNGGCTCLSGNILLTTIWPRCLYLVTKNIVVVVVRLLFFLRLLRDQRYHYRTITTSVYNNLHMLAITVVEVQHSLSIHLLSFTNSWAISNGILSI